MVMVSSKYLILDIVTATLYRFPFLRFCSFRFRKGVLEAGFLPFARNNDAM